MAQLQSQRLAQLLRWGTMLAALSLVGCSVGVGTGFARGEAHVPGCGLAGPFDIEPNFFVADPIDNTVEIRIQSGADQELFSDGVSISVRDVQDVLSRLGEPLQLTGERSAPVAMNFYAHESCPFDRRVAAVAPVNFIAVSGTVTLFALYSSADEEQRLTSGRFDDVLFVDTEDPTHRFARLSGEFEFLFSRGRPAQHFP